MSGSGTSARLACLLPGLEDAARARIAEQLEAHVRLLAMQGWDALLRRCANGETGAAAEALRPAMSAMPDTGPLLARLGDAVTPALLLCMPLADRAAAIAALLANPDVRTRERTLDALGDAAAGCDPVRAACLAWSRRMLMAELGGIASLSHMDRLRLQDRLLVDGPGPLTDEPVPNPEPEPEPEDLTDALRTAANRRATMILAERAGIALSAAETALGLRDPRLLVALCRKAGCDPAEALAVQLQLGHVPPDRILTAGRDGQWPPGTAAIAWQAGLIDEL